MAHTMSLADPRNSPHDAAAITPATTATPAVTAETVTTVVTTVETVAVAVP